MDRMQGLAEDLSVSLLELSLLWQGTPFKTFVLEDGNQVIEWQKDAREHRVGWSESLLFFILASQGKVVTRVEKDAVYSLSWKKDSFVESLQSLFRFIVFVLSSVTLYCVYWVILLVVIDGVGWEILERPFYLPLGNTDSLEFYLAFLPLLMTAWTNFFVQPLWEGSRARNQALGQLRNRLLLSDPGDSVEDCGKSLNNPIMTYLRKLCKENGLDETGEMADLNHRVRIAGITPDREIIEYHGPPLMSHFVILSVFSGFVSWLFFLFWIAFAAFQDLCRSRAPLGSLANLAFFIFIIVMYVLHRKDPLEHIISGLFRKRSMGMLLVILFSGCCALKHWTQAADVFHFVYFKVISVFLIFFFPIGTGMCDMMSNLHRFFVLTYTIVCAVEFINYKHFYTNRLVGFATYGISVTLLGTLFLVFLVCVTAVEFRRGLKPEGIMVFCIMSFTMELLLFVVTL